MFTFDTRLDQRAPFTTGLKSLPTSMTNVVPFGATSLHDAIAQTAQRVGEREGKRRAVVVLTDGADNASHMKPEEVSALASSIDVPVYIFGIVGAIDNPTEDVSTTSIERSAFMVRWPISRRGPAAMCSCRARPGSAVSQRGRSWTSCAISISSRSNRAVNRAGIRSWSAPGTRTSSSGPGVVTLRGNHARSN